jgi:glycosyltransferase involved in cell wall biosynthesis
MNILWISPTPSHPQDAGNRAHIHAMGKQLLAAGHHVTFMLYGQESSTPEAREEMRNFWSEFVFVPKTVNERERSLGELWGIDDWFRRDMEIAVEFMRSQGEYDVVYCEYVFMSKALTYFPDKCLKVLSCHDRMSGRAEMLMRNGIAPDFFYTTPEEEAKALNRADLVLAIQDEEKRYFESITSKPVLEVNYPLERRTIAKTPPEKRLRLGYMASNNSLNRKSLEVFVSELRRRPHLLPDVTLVLSGSICDRAPQFKELDTVLLGRVDEESDFYAQVDIVINPMIDGTGLKIKTVSAIQHRMPFLSTVSGSAGIPGDLPEHKSQTIVDMADHVENLVKNRHRLAEIEAESVRLLDSYSVRSRQQIDDLLQCIETLSTRHARKKRVLVVTDRPFWEPGLGSHSRIETLCAELKRESELTVFFLGSLYPARNEEIKRAGFEGRIVSFKDYEQAAKQLNTESRAPAHETLKRWRHHSFFRSLSVYLSRAEAFDTVVIEYIWLAYLADAVPPGPIKVLDTHDLMSYREYRFTELGLKHHISLTLAEEKSLLENFDAVLAIQDVEARKLEQILEKPLVLCCPHGVTVQTERASYPHEGLTLGFVGGNSDANFEAIRWFLDQVWPVVSRFGVSLNIFGSVCSRLGDVEPGVRLRGLSERLSDIYEQCDVLINPIIQGGGIKIKSVEALAFGRALIASPEGVVGIRDPESSGIVVARSRTEFIDAILDFARHPQKVEQFAAAASKAARMQFEPAVAFLPLTKLIAEL